MLVALVLATVAVVGAGTVVADRLDPEHPADRILAAGVIGSALIAALVWVTGMLGVLGRAGLLLGATGCAVAAIAVTGRRGWRLLRVRRPDLSVTSVTSEPWVAAVVALAAVALAWQALVAVVLPPFAYDGISYHLTIVADWVQHGSLVRSELSLCCASYPLTPDLLFAWPVAITGDLSAVNLVQWPFALLGAVAVAGLARSAGLPGPATVAAGAAFTLTPIVLVQTPTGYVDVIVTAWTLAAVHWLVRFLATADVRRLGLAAAGAGLVLGTKGTGIIWAGALGVAGLGSVAWLVRAGRLPLRRALAGGGIALLVGGALGGHWYVRNWVDTGNPLHPFAVEVAGVTVFDGPLAIDGVLTVPPGGEDEHVVESVARSWATDLTFWSQESIDHQQRSGGLGPLWPWLGLPLLVPFTWRALRDRQPVALAVVLVGAVFVVQPYRWWSRFTIPLVAVAAVAIAVAAWSPVAWRRRAVRSAALALLIVGVGLSSREVDPAARAEPLPALDVLGLIGAPPEERTLAAVFFPEYRFLEALPDDATVEVDLGTPALRFVSPVFGPDLTRTVRASDGDVPAGDVWMVTGLDRPVDARLRSSGTHDLAVEVDGIRVWEPTG